MLEMVFRDDLVVWVVCRGGTIGIVVFSGGIKG